MSRLGLSPRKLVSLPKSPTGVSGLDEILDGGIPRGRPTLICGSAGCGKTLLATEILVRGAVEHREPGVFVAFEETADELAQNVASLGLDLNGLVRRKKLLVDHIRIERSEIEETGDYDLEGLFVRLGHAIDSIGARRMALDTLEVLFGSLSNAAVLRSELKRLFRWLKGRGVTTIVTAERGEGALTRHGIEEYVSDCVLLLDHRVEGQISTRRMRVVKYRGSSHATNEFPFLIDRNGVSVLPITSVGLDYPISNERLSTGIERLDAMLGGAGLFRGSNVLVSGSAGTGKTSIACHVADASCRRGERCLYFAFEESRAQITRNMRSIGLDLEPWLRRGVLRIHGARPSLHGLEMHLVTMHRLIEEFAPELVVVDPIGSLITVGQSSDVHSVLVRLLDQLRSRRITVVMNDLTRAVSDKQGTNVAISSIIDTWIQLRAIESNGERDRGLFVLKSRGMAHSNQIRELLITSRGVDLADVSLGPEGRPAQEARARTRLSKRRAQLVRKRLALDRKRRVMKSQVSALRLAFEADRDELDREIAEDAGGAGESSHNERVAAGKRRAGADGDRRTARRSR